MIGGSYGGQIQYAVARHDQRVDALIPIITWNDLSYSLAPNNTDFAHGVTYATPGVAKQRVGRPVLRRSASPTALQDVPVDPQRTLGRARTSPTEACPALVEAQHRSATPTTPRSGWRGTRRSRRT